MGRNYFPPIANTIYGKKPKNYYPLDFKQLKPDPLWVKKYPKMLKHIKCLFGRHTWRCTKFVLTSDSWNETHVCLTCGKQRVVYGP